MNSIPDFRAIIKSDELRFVKNINDESAFSFSYAVFIVRSPVEHRVQDGL